MEGYTLEEQEELEKEQEETTRKKKPDESRAVSYTGPVGVSVQPHETHELLNLLYLNPRPWNRRLRVASHAYVNILIEEGKLDGHYESMGMVRERG